MKKVMLTLLAVLLMATMARATEPNVPTEPQNAICLWVSGDDLAYQNTDLSVWLGLRSGDVEGGIAADWRMFSEGDIQSDLQSNLALGPYGAYHFPNLLSIDNPIDVEWLPDQLVGEPFISCSYLLDLRGKGTSLNPGVGMRVLDVFALNWTYSMYQGIPADDEGRFGLSFEWRFK